MGVSPAFSASNEVETPRMPDELGAKAETEAVARALTVMMSFMACRSSKMTIEIMGLRRKSACVKVNTYALYRVQIN